MSAPKASSSGYRFLLQFESCGGARKTNLINCFNCRSDELSKGDSHVRLLRKRRKDIRIKEGDNVCPKCKKGGFVMGGEIEEMSVPIKCI